VPLPVIVGAGQVVQRPGSVPLSQAQGPIELMIEAARRAADDAGAAGLLERIGWVGVAGGWFRFDDPGRHVADGLAAPSARTALASISGTAPQDLLAQAAERIAQGELEMALVVGGEAKWSAGRLKKVGEKPSWLSDEGQGGPVISGWPDEVRDEGRQFAGAVTGYALFEDSLRAAAGKSVDEQRDIAAALVARFSEVAASNPYAWDQSVYSPSEVRVATDSNRMVSFPYTKTMVANNTVDMASAVLLCSEAVARQAGVAEERLVFPHVVSASHETWRVASRHPLHGAPALAAAGRAAYEHLGVGPESIRHVDLYACFPSIVQMSSAALGFSLDRQLTLFGGLAIAGAPVGNATGHALAAMVHKAREGGLALVHGNGGVATKHSVGIYSTERPAAFARILCEEVNRQPVDTLPSGWSGDVTVEAATVRYDRTGPTGIFAAVRDATGRRGFATSSSNGELVDAAQKQGLVGLSGVVTAEGELRA
jgi:acetyl-CoA C-acetyltransferase